MKGMVRMVVVILIIVDGGDGDYPTEAGGEEGREKFLRMERVLNY
jgi:hypothetical protein